MYKRGNSLAAHATSASAHHHQMFQVGDANNIQMDICIYIYAGERVRERREKAL